jgi:hypothetical protein
LGEVLALDMELSCWARCGVGIVWGELEWSWKRMGEVLELDVELSCWERCWSGCGVELLVECMDERKLGSLWRTKIGWLDGHVEGNGMASIGL